MGEQFDSLLSLKQMDISFSCVCPVIDKTVDPRGDSRVDAQTTLWATLKAGILERWNDGLAESRNGGKSPKILRRNRNHKFSQTFKSVCITR